MQFQVPQFIEIEDKIFGPLTFKQFLYLAGGGGLCFLLYTLLPLFFAILLIIPAAGFSLALAFYKINNRPFIEVAESAFRYTSGSKLFIWKKEERPIARQKQAPAAQTQQFVPKLSDSKLKDLAWSLDVHKELK